MHAVFWYSIKADRRFVFGPLRPIPYFLRALSPWVKCPRGESAQKLANKHTTIIRFRI
jgi:hypothetical protein